MRVVVIGGGLAGLTTADKLQHSHDVTVLEARDFLGGRIRSVYTEDTKRLLYEAGPWRIPSSHTNMIKLCIELGLQLDDIQTPTPTPFFPPNDRHVGMSVWEAYALQSKNPIKADVIDLSSGYANETDGADMTYATTQQETYKTVKEGFSEICTRLRRRIKGNITLNCRVVDVVVKSGPEYTITYVQRIGNKFETKARKADAVFVCVPPHVCKEWSALRDHASPILHAVMSKPLNHIYVNGAHMQGVHDRRADSLLAQSISAQYPQNTNSTFIPPYITNTITGWYQLSYSAGRVARFWYNLFINNQSRFFKVLFEEAGKISDTGQPRKLLDNTNVKMHFWEHAVHMWRPTPNFNVDKAVQKARQPHPFKLPNLYFAGEAFSKEQAWMEGALTTAYAAVGEFLNRQRPRPVAINTDAHIVIDGRVIDVSAWSRVHPGGELAIRNHLQDRDIHELFKHIGHSSNAWAIIFGLQVGFDGNA